MHDTDIYHLHYHLHAVIPSNDSDYVGETISKILVSFPISNDQIVNITALRDIIKIYMLKKWPEWMLDGMHCVIWSSESDPSIWAIIVQPL